jgi:hypothetical protein
MYRKILIVAVAAAFSAQIGLADEHEPNIGEEKGDGVLEPLTLAADLAQFGRENEDPAALWSAARILRQYEIESEDREKTTEGEQSDEPGSKEAEPAEFSADALFEEALTLAGDDTPLGGLITESQETRMRGRVGGAACTTDRVLAGSTDIYNVRFRGNSFAEVMVSGDGDTDLDLYVYDENGNEICRDIDYTDSMYCSWNPRWTGPFRLEIVNLGGIWNQYDMCTN